MVLDGSGMKWCPDCRRDLPVFSFTRNKRMRDGLAFYCGPCARKRVVDSKRKRLGPPRTRSGRGPAEVPDGQKWCPECGAIKTLAEFPRNRSQKSGYGSYCKPCHNAITQRDKEKHGGARNYHLRRRYGITAEHVDRMLTEQNGVCAICLEAPAVHVDHDHATGRVRGLLCFNCNGALGQFRDRADLMTRAAVYLSAGSGAVAELASFEFDVSTGAREGPRPDDADNAYLFEFLDEAVAV